MTEIAYIHYFKMTKAKQRTMQRAHPRSQKFTFQIRHHVTIERLRFIEILNQILASSLPPDRECQWSHVPVHTILDFRINNL